MFASFLRTAPTNAAYPIFGYAVASGTVIVPAGIDIMAQAQGNLAAVCCFAVGATWECEILRVVEKCVGTESSYPRISRVHAYTL